MPTIVQELTDEWSGLANMRAPWENYWRDIAAYVLPQTQHFDMLVSKGGAGALNSVVSTPVASRRSKDLYDMTSLWAIERLTAGMISLKTPESQTWHDLGTDDIFGVDQTHEEKLSCERLRDYLFRVRSNPAAGFWPAHKSAMRSMCAFGDGWMFIEEVMGQGAKLPYLYSYMPLYECFPGVNTAGQPDRMHRCFRWSALQVVNKFGAKNLPKTIVDMANDPKKKHDTIRLLHAIRPRDEASRAVKLGSRGAAFASYYCLPDENDGLIGESGYFEYPFTRYSWNNSGVSPFSEGPVACAIGELKSLQEMAKNELIAVQSMIRPAYGTAGKNFVRLNFNPGATNPNMINPDGKPLFAPITGNMRPDFAQSVIEARRNSVRELLYLNLWQIIIQSKGEGGVDTATAALIKAQEKGEMLGPVGISLNEGLAHSVDREIGILNRKGAFEDDSPLAMPDSMADKDVAPKFTSPLDRLRRMGELVGMQQLVQFCTLLGGGDPQQTAKIMARLDPDEMIEKAQEILGAPVSVLTSRDAANEQRGQQDQMAQMLTALETMRAGGEAATATGQGAVAAAEGAEAATNSPALANLTQNMPALAQGAVNGARAVQ